MTIITKLNLKYINTHDPLKINTLKQNLIRYARKLRLTNVFHNPNQPNTPIPIPTTTNIIYNKCKLPNPKFNVSIIEEQQLENNQTPIPIQLIETLENNNKSILTTYTTNKHKHQYSNRKSQIQTKTLTNIATDIDVLLVTTDKNLGPALVLTSWYNKTMLDTLTNPKNYTPIPNTPQIVTKTINSIRYDIECICKHNKITIEHPIRKYLLQPYDITFCKPYINPKVHKITDTTPILKGRLICPNTKYITYAASKFIYFFLQELLTSCTYAINSSNTLLQLLEHTTINKTDYLVSFDVQELYPSIPPRRAIDAINTHLLKDNEINNYRFEQYRLLILSLLELVLLNNYLQYETLPTSENKTTTIQYFLQISGIAMGTPVAVTVSNLYLHIIETSAINSMIHAPKIYTRYIDDIFAIVPSLKYKNNLLHSLNSQDTNIKVTDESNYNSINYLDITISKNRNMPKTDRLNTNLYHKPISKFLYMNPTTFQPLHIITNTIINELKRIHKTCSLPLDTLKHREQYYNRLRLRDHSPHTLKTIFQKPTPTRQHILHHKKKKEAINSPILITQYHPFIIHHKKKIQSTLKLPKIITDKYPHLPKSKPIIAFKNNTSIYTLYKQLRRKHIHTLTPIT